MQKKLFNRKPDYAVFIEQPSLFHSRNHYIFKFSLPENSFLPTSIPTSYIPVLTRAHISCHAKIPTQLSKRTSNKLLSFFRGPSGLMSPLWAQPKTEYSQLPKITKSRTEVKSTIRLDWKEREGNHYLHKHRSSIGTGNLFCKSE